MLEKAVASEEGGDEYNRIQPFQTKNLSQFGYNFFRPAQPGFSPLTDIPVGPDYVVGPGDRIILSLWGIVDGTYELEVNRSGEVILPRAGAVRVWGMPFGKLHDVFKARLARVFKDFDLNVTMGKLRTMKVFVVGEVKAPGDHNISSLSTVINALSAAGGPLKTGSLRNIQIRREGKVVDSIDLYDFFLKGDKSRDLRLQAGDTIFVPVIGPVAGIGGNVKRPALYELKGEKTLKDLVVLAEGLLPTGYLQRVQISRIEAHDKKVVSDFNIDPKSAGKSLDALLDGIGVQDMDIVKIFQIDSTLRGHVRLNGYVRRPGDYALQPGMKLSNLLREDNILPEYYSGACEVTRLFPPDLHPEVLFVSPAKALQGDPEHDLVLKEFDKVRVFTRWEMEEMPKVWVNGEVQRPGEYRLFPRMTVRDLLMEAGNMKNTAYLRNAEIMRISPTGEKVSSAALNIDLEEAMKGNEQHNITLAPYDKLTVRKIPNWSEETQSTVLMKGEFRFPGAYPIFNGEKLSAVMKRAGGFTDKAYLRGAKFIRKSVKELQQKRMKEMLVKTEQELLKKQADVASVSASKEELDATKAALDALTRRVELLKTAEAEGRLVIHLDRIDSFANSIYDVEVQEGDVLEIPQTPSSVNVLGQVYNPTSIIPVEDQDIAFYLDKTGGPTTEADEGEIYIVKIDGTVASRKQVSLFKNLFYPGFLSTRVDPGDTIIVPQRYEKVAWVRDIKDITTILSQIALTAGVVVAAGL